jgi:hypothetical protein
MVANMEAHYARLPNQPNLREIWAFHQRLVLPPSRRGRSEITREFTVVYPNPDLKVNAPGTGGAPGNEDLGPWQSHMAWEYGTDWVAGFLAHQRRYVTGPPPANVGLWPIAPLTHHESEESEEEGGNEGRGAAEGTQGGEGPQGVTAPSGPVMAPPSIAAPVIAPTIPTTGRTSVSAPPVIPTPTVAPTPVATPTVPVTLGPQRPVSSTTTAGVQLPRERPPATEERQPKRVATEAAATLQGPQLTAGGGPAGPAASTVSSGGAQADQRWDKAKAEVQRLWALGQQLQTEAQTKPTYTSFKETAKMAQDTFEAAETASRQAWEERMASVGALPMTGLQLPGAPAVLEPSEQLETNCQDQVQALAVEIVNRGAAARATYKGCGGQRGRRALAQVGGQLSLAPCPRPQCPQGRGCRRLLHRGQDPPQGPEEQGVGQLRASASGPLRGSPGPSHVAPHL